MDKLRKTVVDEQEKMSSKSFGQSSQKGFFDSSSFWKMQVTLFFILVFLQYYFPENIVIRFQSYLFFLNLAVPNKILLKSAMFCYHKFLSIAVELSGTLCSWWIMLLLFESWCKISTHPKTFLPNCLLLRKWTKTVKIILSKNSCEEISICVGEKVAFLGISKTIFSGKKLEERTVTIKWRKKPTLDLAEGAVALTVDKALLRSCYR